MRVVFHNDPPLYVSPFRPGPLAHLQPVFVTEKIVQELVHHLATDKIPQDVIPELLYTIFDAEYYRIAMENLPELVVKLWVERLDQVYRP